MRLLFSLFLPLAVGGIAGALTRSNVGVYESLTLPDLSPSASVFPIVWSALYIIMGIASYLVWRAEGNTDTKKQALSLYVIQLVFNFIWPLLFFNLQNYLAAFIWLILLLLLVIATIALFARVSKPAAWLMIPYVLWILFAGYLNFSVYLLNR